MSSNQFKGQFTAELGFRLGNLQVLEIQQNKRWKGALIGFLRLFGPETLTHLNLSGNQYTGTIPTYLAKNLGDTLVSFDVSNNKITGTIPTELAGASKVQLIQLGGNRNFEGTIPTELARLTALTLLDLSGTSVTGKIPEELCSLQQQGRLQVVADCGSAVLGNTTSTSLECCPEDNVGSNHQNRSLQ